MAEKQTGRFGEIIRAARNPGEQGAREPEDQGAREPENQKAKAKEPDVNLCVKVPRAMRQHWAAMAKLKGTTLTAVITAALEAEFGKPE